MAAILTTIVLTWNTETKYLDSYGNTFIIKNIETSPEDIDVEFLKVNLNSSHFVKKFGLKIPKYQFVLLEVNKTNEYKYELRMEIESDTRIKRKNDKILNHHMPANYFMLTQIVHNQIKIRSIKLIG